MVFSPKHQSNNWNNGFFNENSRLKKQENSFFNTSFSNESFGDMQKSKTEGDFKLLDEKQQKI